MKQSIKIDIIYFRVDRDTKMEFRFNDAGKMPVRTLASPVNDRDEFLYALKRGVYRSDTVIVVGGLGGNIYIPGIIGAAIGAPAEKVDYRALGFAEPAKPLVFPKGSIPLVTSDNRIGGMLLEKGRQSIIVLSEDTAVRHQLLNSLVYPYIFDLGMEDEPFVSDPVGAAPVAPTVEEVVTDAVQEVFSSSAVEMAEEIVEETVEEVAEAEAMPAEDEPAEETVETKEEPVEDIVEDTLEEPAEEIAEAETEEIAVEEIEEVAEEEPETVMLPNVSDGMFVIADDGSNDEDPDDVTPETIFSAYGSMPVEDKAFDAAVFTGYQEETDDEGYYGEEEYYKPRVSVGKIIGIAVALLCIGASAAIFTMIIMGLL